MIFYKKFKFLLQEIIIKCLNIEIWKNINLIEYGGEDYTGIYQISNFGRVKSLGRLNSRGFKLKEKILKIHKNHPENNNSYIYVTLNKKGISKQYFVHRLVTQMFIFNLENKPQVNHKNNIHSNNNINNLEWVTQNENIQHAYDNQYMTSYQVFQYNKYTKKFIRVYKNAYEASKITGISISSIRYACERFKKVKDKKLKFSQAGGYLWSYKGGVSYQTLAL